MKCPNCYKISSKITVRKVGRFGKYKEKYPCGCEFFVKGVGASSTITLTKGKRIKFIDKRV